MDSTISHGIFTSPCTSPLKILPHQKKLKPPGPKPWPFIGNLDLIGSLPHCSLHSLSKIYGQIMLLKFGKFPVVVASSPHMAKQFLRVHDAVFVSRPPLAAGKYTSYNFSDMTWSPYGPYWRRGRQIFLTEVFSSKKIQSFQYILVEERRKLISRLYSLSLAGTPVVLREHLMRFTISSISRIILGDKFWSDESEKDELILEELREMLDEWFFLGGALSIGDWIPVLDFLDLHGYVKRMKALSRRWDKFNSRVIDYHVGKRGDDEKDVVDALLEPAEDRNHQVKITIDGVKALVQDLLTGGIDTSAATIEWIITEMMRQPRIFTKAKEEVERVIGRERWVDENDLSQLPYLDANVIESMRLHPLSTLLAPRYCMKDCNVEGYNISKGTMVLINAWSIGRDPNTYDEPELFLPERFMGKGIDTVEGNNFGVLPFGFGRRRCPGYGLGLKIVRTTLANLLQGFDMKLMEGMKGEDVSMEEEYGLTTHPKHPLAVVMEPTLPTHLY